MLVLLVAFAAVSYAQSGESTNGTNSSSPTTAPDVCKMCKYSFTCCVQCLMCCCSSGTISELMIAPAHNITIESGTTVSLNCSAKHTSGQNCSMCLVWKHDDVLLSDANFISMDGALSNTLPLTVDMSNQGEYSCQTNGTMTETVKSVYITTASETLYNNYYAILFIMIIITSISHLFSAVSIEGSYTNIRIGNFDDVSCMIVPSILTTTYKWLSQDRSVVASSSVLTLIGSLAIDQLKYTCLVNSSQLYSPIEKTITVTVQGMYANL